MTRTTFLILMAALGLTDIASFASPDQLQQMRLVIFKKERLVDILRPLRLDDRAIKDVRRNSDGTKLFVTYYGAGTNGEQVAVISPTGLRVIPSMGISPNLADDATLVSFERNCAVVIGSSEISYSNLNAQIGFSPGASFYYVFNKGAGTSNYGTSIYRTSQPRQPIVTLPTNFWPTGMYATDQFIDVDGYFYPDGGQVHDRSNRAWTLLRFRLLATGVFGKYAQIPVKGTIVDVDQRDQVVLGRTFGDLFPSWFLYNMATGAKEKIGRVHGYAFFLAPSLAGIFDNK